LPIAGTQLLPRPPLGQRQKIKGRKQSEEHKKKKGEAIRGEKNGMYGKNLTEKQNFALQDGARLKTLAYKELNLVHSKKLTEQQKIEVRKVMDRIRLEELQNKQ
jgi:hypothetical protein